MVAAGTLLSGCGTATPSDSGQLAAAIATKSCDLPAHMSASAPGQELTGPAVSDLTGGPAVHGFSLDGGKFSITPPPAGDVPRVTRTQAECEEQAAVDGNGFTLSLQGSGMAIGYGLVTVSPRLPVSSWQYIYPGTGLPTPAAPSYRSRLAWVLVIRVQEIASCPAETATTSQQASKYHGYNYVAFIVNATTGGSALLYTESAPAPCNQADIDPPSLAIPIELTSVPWKLDSRGTDGYYGTLTAYVPACDGLNSVADVDRGTDLVRVLAYGQVAANCGPPRPVTVYLEAGDVFQQLPSTLVHAPVGLYITEPQQPSGPQPAATGTIVTVGGTNAGQTITVHVGGVIAPVPFPPNPAQSPLVHSSDPAVLGLLGPPQLQSSLSEFRAWQPGRVTLSSAYHGWRLHIIVLAR